MAILASIAGLSLLSWIYLVFFRGMFWRTDQTVEAGPAGVTQLAERPSVRIVIPARNEADILPETLPSLLGQDYPGEFEIVIVDDRSEDGTAEVARDIADQTGHGDRLTVISGEEVPAGWTGKLWALEQGIREQGVADPELLLFTDADISHPANSLPQLVAKLAEEDLDLVSVMVQLRVRTFWEKLLIPAFVYFFGKLYPFRWVNDRTSKAAGAAGGCVLLRKEVLTRAGGLPRISAEIIDDCALARIVKYGGREGGGRLWLGLSRRHRSLRAYDSLTSIWDMVARTAFTQLRHSSLLLAATVLGMLLLYAVPPLSALAGLLAATCAMGGSTGAVVIALGLLGWGLMSMSYLPMLAWYGTPPWLAPLLPISASLYTLMTVGSAWLTWRGRGGAWKGRTYGALPTEGPSHGPTA